jgi:hypothetical protein
MPRGSLNEDYSKKVLGVLFTGYLDKRNPSSGAFKQRFVVLTHEALHWFVKHNESQDLFGEERGQVSLTLILSVRILDEDGNIFEIVDTHTNKRTFRASSPNVCEEWVSAIRSAIKGAAPGKLKALNRRGSGVDDDAGSGAGNDEDGSEVYVSLVSLQTRTSEVVLARNPNWDRLINIPNVRPDDKVQLFSAE